MTRTNDHWSDRLRKAVALLLMLSPWAASGQLLDSIGLFLQEPAKFQVVLDTRGSFISNQNVRLWGVKVGLEHGERVRYGIGYSFLGTLVERDVEVEGQGTVRTKLRLGYVTPYFSYAFYQRRHWEVSIPVQIGIGGGSVVYTDSEGRKQKLEKAFVFFYEPAMTVQYRFLKYFAIGGGWGFRLAITDADLNESLNAPIYLFGLKVYFGDLWRDLSGAGE